MRAAEIGRIALQNLPLSTGRHFDGACKRPIMPVYIRKLVAFIDEAKKHDGQA